MKTFSGIPVSAGFVFGKVFVCPDNDENLPIPHYSITKTEIPHEWDRFQKAVDKSANELKEMIENIGETISKEQAGIFQAHLLMLEDLDFHDQINERMKKQLQNIEWIIMEISQDFIKKMTQSSDPLLKERAVDIADVSNRIINLLLGVESNRTALAGLTDEVIIAAANLMPSDTLILDKTKVKGIVMDSGSKTCHTAILARSFNIPAVLGLSNLSKEIKNGQMIALNGSTGLVVIDPDKKTLRQMQNDAARERNRIETLRSLLDFPAETADGRRVKLKANIEVPEEALVSLQYGAQGIGLYRSEFLFLKPGEAAGEDFQFESYSTVLKVMGSLPVTIRTADIGGDKVIHGSINEKNPLLGWRAIRVSLAETELFKTQLRAILRASVFGNVRIMFPMVSGIEELEQARSLLEEARAECIKKGQQVADAIPVGTMIEVPSAAMTADILAESSAFFSIGTNDLIQYSMAVDRENEKVSYLGQSLHPAVLRFIKNAIDAAHKNKIKAAMCGELASDPSATAILLGLGLDEFSMTASAIPQIKEIIRSVNMASCQELAEQVLRQKTIAQVRSLASAWMADNAMKRNS